MSGGGEFARVQQVDKRGPKLRGGQHFAAWADSWHHACRPMKWRSGSKPFKWMRPTMRCPLSLLLLRLSACSQAGKEKDAVVALLRKLAPLYNKLYDAAKAALVPLPGGRPCLIPCAAPVLCRCCVDAALLAPWPALHAPGCSQFSGCIIGDPQRGPATCSACLCLPHAGC